MEGGMIRNLSCWTCIHRGTVRGVVYGGIGLGIAINFLTDDAVSVARIAWLLFLFAGIAITAESLIFTGRPKGKILLDGSQTALTRRESVPSFVEMIEESENIWLLGGTFKTFTDDSRNLEALARFYARRSSGLQILMMHPEGQGLESTARARRARGKGDSVITLQMEIAQSLNRFVDYLGPQCVRQIYVFKEHPTYAMYKFGNKWIVTVYTLGRGASSPAMYFKEIDSTREFCQGLERGFNDVRDAETTEPADRLPRNDRGHFFMPGFHA